MQSSSQHRDELPWRTRAQLSFGNKKARPLRTGLVGHGVDSISGKLLFLLLCLLLLVLVAALASGLAGKLIGA
jgi:hypothetical protein